jgi:hypothetical protein
VARLLLALVCWSVLGVPLLADTGPLFVERLVDARHIVVVTRAGESLLLEREPGDENPQASQILAQRHVFAVQRRAGRFLLDDGSGRTLWVVVRSLGWNPRTRPVYWLLIVAGGALLSPLLVVAWRWFDRATESAVTRYSHGPPPQLEPGEVAASALPHGWRLWMSGTSSAVLGLLGVSAIVLLGLGLLVTPAVVDPIKRPTLAVVAIDLAATAAGIVVLLWLVGGYLSGVRSFWWAVSGRLSFLLRPRSRTRAIVRHAGTIATESGSDSSIAHVHLLVYAFTAPHQGRDWTFVVGEVVSRQDDLAVGPTLEIEYVTGRPALVRRIG